MLILQIAIKHSVLLLTLLFLSCSQDSLVIRGKLVTEDNSPLDKTLLWVTGPSMLLVAIDVASDGTFELRNLDDGDYKFQVIPEGHAPLVWLEAISSETKLLKIPLHKGKSIRFQILDTEQNPISGVELRNLRWDDDTMALCSSDLFFPMNYIEKSDFDGHIVWHNAPTNARYTFMHDNYLNTLTADLKPIEQTYPVLMHLPIIIQGNLIDAETRQKITGNECQIMVVELIKHQHDNHVFEYWAANGTVVFRPASNAYVISPLYYNKNPNRIEVVVDGYEKAVSSEFFLHGGDKEINLVLKKIE